MKKYIYIVFIGLFGFLSSCEKDGEQIVMLENPIAPTLVTIPDLTLERNNGTQTLEFVGTPVDPGFTASAKYFLEACATGNNFTNTVLILTDVQASSFKITVSDLNGILLKKFPADETSSIDFRIRAELVTDAGTGAQTFEYVSATSTANVFLYGLPRLNLLNSGMDQKIESALGNGVYSGFVKVDKTLPFTLEDPDSNTEYGGSGGVLAVNGAGITVAESGWHDLSADVNNLSYSINAYMIGLVGSATPNGWDSPDQKMDYDAQSGTWYITLDLVDGEIKFRKNDGWAWNLGGTPDNLVADGSNIAVTAGNYTITLTITSDAGKTGTCTIVKN